VTGQALADALDQYRAGLETGVRLLRQLHAVAGRQKEGTERRDFDHLARESDERARLTQALVAIEPGLREIRAVLDTAENELASMPAYGEVLKLRQAAADLVSSILATDEESMRALADAELARRAAMSSLECGEATLAAYRRVLTPPMASASLFDRRG
jgi:hypothetical protein